MRNLLIILVVGAVAYCMFLFGNSLRCMYAVDSCPYMCKQININCSNRYDMRCQRGGLVCQGLSTGEYYDRLKSLAFPR